MAHGNKLEEWLRFRTRESGLQAIAALEWNVSDCGKQLEALGRLPDSQFLPATYRELEARQHEAKRHLAIAKQSMEGLTK